MKSPYHPGRSALGLLLLLTLIRPSHGEDWPCWRGSKGNGVSVETLPIPDLLDKGVMVRWTVTVGWGHSAVSIRDGLLYTQGSGYFEGGDKEAYHETVHCLDALTGEAIWRYAYPSEFRPYAGPRATPAVDGDRLFTLGARGQLHCFDARRGTVLWSKDLVSEKLSRISSWGFCGSPVVHGDVLLLNAGRSGIALDKGTGSVIWRSEPGACSVATPVVAEIRGKPAVLLNTDRVLYAAALSTGEEIWSLPWPYCDADPVLVGDRIFIFGGKPANERCRTLVDLATGAPETIWPEKEMNVAFQSWIASGGHAFGITWDKKRHRIQCVDLATGEFTWRRDIDDWGALTMAGGLIIFIEGDGDLVIFRASPDAYEEVFRKKLLHIKGFDEYPEYQPNVCWTAPVICNGRIYVRSAYGEIVCVEFRR